MQSITRDRQRHLAEITNLRAALRDAMARSDQAAIIGKLHLDVDHLRLVVSRVVLAPDVIDKRRERWDTSCMHTVEHLGTGCKVGAFVGISVRQDVCTSYSTCSGQRLW